MPEYNMPMFAAYANGFLLYKDLHGEEAALRFMRKWFERNLKPAYDRMGFQKGSTQEAAAVMGKRDEAVGLVVKFPVIEPATLVYEFHTDPFPMLKGLVDPRKFDACYVQVKVAHLLGDDWFYRTPQHIWENGSFTQHIITRR